MIVKKQNDSKTIIPHTKPTTSLSIVLMFVGYYKRIGSLFFESRRYCKCEMFNDELYYEIIAKGNFLNVMC